MKPNCAIFIKLLLVQCLAIGCVSQRYNSCCYPTIGKPKTDFSIQWLQPNYNDGSNPSNCNPNSPFVKSKISDLISRMQVSWPTLACPSSSGSLFWSHELEKHGTCPNSILDQHEYFQASLNLKDRVDLLQILESARIQPDESSYSLLYQLYICIGTSRSQLIKCPVLPKGGCASNIDFPTF
ncbi:hypothetical protein RGQ29_015828 [Quercus rubra]|uniref:Uncharacterized protein n=1 Tax=Quercus rubra TaxID=3512 RepID=A0AAN7J3Z3_QUERU|nr:hypothetical protein RGQ29_015828 [Quercus rubra]